MPLISADFTPGQPATSNFEYVTLAHKKKLMARFDDLHGLSEDDQLALIRRIEILAKIQVTFEEANNRFDDDVEAMKVRVKRDHPDMSDEDIINTPVYSACLALLHKKWCPRFDEIFKKRHELVSGWKIASPPLVSHDQPAYENTYVDDQYLADIERERLAAEELGAFVEATEDIPTEEDESTELIDISTGIAPLLAALDITEPTDDATLPDTVLINLSTTDEPTPNPLTNGLTDPFDEGPPIPYFWLFAITANTNLASLLRVTDQPILKHLLDVRIQWLEHMSFAIVFAFAPNDHFYNATIRKEFHYKHLHHGRARVESESAGDTIYWKPNMDQTWTPGPRTGRRLVREGFFDILSQSYIIPGIESVADGPNLKVSSSLLDRDFAFAECFLDDVLPNAWFWYTRYVDNCVLDDVEPVEEIEEVVEVESEVAAWGFTNVVPRSERWID